MTDSMDRTDHSPSAPEVDAERIAALLDGRLGAPERAEVLAHLAASDADFEAFADALAATRELEAEGAAAGVDETGVTPLQANPRRGWQRPVGHWLALAAAVLGLVALPVVWTRLREPGLDDPGRYAALLAEERAGLPAGWDRSPWGTTRGPGDPLTPEARAVRVGVRLTDLEVAVAARDPLVPALAAEIGSLLGEVPAGGVVAAYYREIGRRAAEGPEQLRPLLESGRKAAAGLLGEEMVALGAWAEAGRIAVARRDAEFFRSGGTRAVLDRAATVLEPSETVRTAVERIRRATAGDGAPDWVLLADSLAELLGVLGG